MSDSLPSDSGASGGPSGAVGRRRGIALGLRYSPDQNVGRMFQNSHGNWVRVAVAEGLLEALQKIAAYRPLTFAECSDAEAVIGIAEEAVAKATSMGAERKASSLTSEPDKQSTSRQPGESGI